MSPSSGSPGRPDALLNVPYAQGWTTWPGFSPVPPSIIVVGSRAMLTPASLLARAMDPPRVNHVTFTAARPKSITASAAITCRSWPAVNPDRAPSLIHSNASTAPPRTITALASHGSSCRRNEPASWVRKLGCPATAEFAWPLSAFHLASPAWQNLAIAATAATTPVTAAADQAGLSPKPRACATVPNDPVLRVSHEISGGAASIARPRPAVRRAAQLTTFARLALRSGSSGFSQAHHRARVVRRRLSGGSSVSHQNANSSNVIPAPITEGSHHAIPVAAAVIARGPDGTSTPCQRSSQPQACVNA